MALDDTQQIKRLVSGDEFWILSDSSRHLLSFKAGPRAATPRPACGHSAPNELFKEGILPPRQYEFSPNLTAFAEQFVGAIKEECLGRMIFVGQQPDPPHLKLEHYSFLPLGSTF